MVKVLIAITSHNEPFYPDGKKTGLFFSEAFHPFEIFRALGWEIDFASENGKWGYDEHSIVEPFLTGDDATVFADKNSEFNKAIENVKSASELNSEDYDIFFAAGGHGTIFDFPNAKKLHLLASDIYAKGNIVSAVCHGPAIFDGLLDKSTGEPLIKGKKVTGFTDEGEAVMGLDTILAENKLKTVKTVADESGAIYVAPAGPWDDFTVEDQRIITGVNPQSASSVAKLIVKSFTGK